MSKLDATITAEAPISDFQESLAGLRLTETHIRQLLDEILDPCSCNAGAPAGINTMGLVRSIEIADAENGGQNISVVLGLTEPGCLMGWVFLRETETRLKALPQVSATNVTLDAAHLWTPDAMEPTYRAKLDEARKTQFARVLAQRKLAQEKAAAQ